MASVGQSSGSGGGAGGDWSPESQSCGDHDYFEDHPSSGFGVELEVENAELETHHHHHSSNTSAKSKEKFCLVFFSSLHFLYLFFYRPIWTDASNIADTLFFSSRRLSVRL